RLHHALHASRAIELERLAGADAQEVDGPISRDAGGENPGPKVDGGAQVLRSGPARGRAIGAPDVRDALGDAGDRASGDEDEVGAIRGDGGVLVIPLS